MADPGERQQKRVDRTQNHLRTEVYKGTAEKKNDQKSVLDHINWAMWAGMELANDRHTQWNQLKELKRGATVQTMVPVWGHEKQGGIVQRSQNNTGMGV